MPRLNWTGPVQPCRCESKQCLCAGLGGRLFRKHYAIILKLMRPKRVFEWGPGLSTEMALDAKAEVFTVSDRWDYVPRQHRIGKGFTAYVHKPDTPEYVSMHDQVNIDIYFIDGRRRAECLKLAHQWSTDKSIVLLHDAQRIRYHKALELFPHVHFIDRSFAAASKSEDRIQQIREMRDRKPDRWKTRRHV